MFNIKYFFAVLAFPSDDGQQWLKYAKAVFYILIPVLLHLMYLTTHSCIKKFNSSRYLLKHLRSVLKTEIFLAKFEVLMAVSSV
jgi:hypothetical protein